MERTIYTGYDISCHDKDKIIPTVLTRLEKLPEGHYLELLTYKRNRSVVIVRVRGEELLVIERGYLEARFHIGPDALRKLLKTLLKKEFPGSRKIRLCEMGAFVEKDALSIKQKTL